MSTTNDWPGMLPQNWRRAPVRRIFHIANGSTPKTDVYEYWNGDIPWTTPDDLGSLESDTLYEPLRYITRAGYASCGTTLVPAGSLLLSTRAPIGHVAIAGVPVCTNQGCRALFPVRSDEVVVRYYYYQLVAARQHLASRGMGSTFTELGRDRLAEFDMAVPPYQDQRAITTFLDRKTAQIDALVAAYERLLILLEEKRQAVITQAVTKGLDPTVPMKDSGVEWLGEVPAHWEVRAFRFCAQINEGQVNPTDLKEVNKILVAPDHIERGTGQLIARVTAEEQGAISGKYQAWPGQIIYSKIRPALNKLCIAEGNWLCSADMYAISPSEQLVTEWLFYFMLSIPFVESVTLASQRVAMPKVNREELSSIPILVPPINEQKKIFNVLSQVCSQIDKSRKQSQVAIELLKEYRSALITAAVTGQIDMHEEVTQDA